MRFRDFVTGIPRVPIAHSARKHADMTHKQQAIDRTAPPTAKASRYKPPDALLAFLENL